MSVSVRGQPSLNLDFIMENVTEYKGEVVRLRCEISVNPLPEYTWYRDNIEIGDNEDRFNIKQVPWGSRYVQIFDTVRLRILHHAHLMRLDS